MSDYDRLKEMLKDTKEDTPLSCGMFKEFRDNHFNHLKWDVCFLKRMVWILLGAIIAAAIADKF